MTESTSTSIARAAIGDFVTVVRIDGSIFMVTANRDGSVPLNSRLLARLEECAPETADAICAAINRGKP